jgi:hypothetical protein
MRLILFITLTLAMLSADSGVLDIQWPRANNATLKPAAAYPAVLRNGTQNVHLPVYLTKSMAYDKNMVVVSGANFYSISFELNGASLLVEGDKTFQDSVQPNNAEFQKIVKISPSVEYIAAEGIMTAEFNRHGVNYAITIECESPKRDKRCSEKTLISKLYNDLIMVGGRP